MQASHTLRRLVPLCALSCLMFAGPVHAAVLGSFDQVFAGDDPSEVFEYDLPFDPAVPTLLAFNGFAENLNSGPEAETGVRFQLRWRPDVGDGGGVDLPADPDFRGVRLPPADPVAGPVRVPLQFDALAPYSPALVRFGVEGLGPFDRFRFVGDFSIRPVPEPAALGLVLLAALPLFRFTRRHFSSPLPVPCGT